VAAILGLSAFTLNFAGFGNAVVALPLLALFMPLDRAVALQFPFGLCLVIYNAWRWRARIDRRRLGILTLFALAALPLGFLTLKFLPAEVMKKSLAGFIVLAVVASRLGLGGRLARVRSFWLGAVCGFMSGFFQGAYTTGGPPAVVFVRATTDDPEAAKGLLGGFFAVICLATAVMFGASGFVDGGTLLTCLYFSPAVAIGAVAGAWAFKRLSSRGYALVVEGLLVAAALLLWFRA
jgi:uncharacterized membrane protein YfcA